MHTPEQARTLWCPMARVAQAGNADIHAAYNRSLTKTLVPVRLATVKGPDDFNLGDEATETQDALMLKMSSSPSSAAMCMGDGCAMWRWEPTTASVPTTTIGAGGEPARTFKTRTVKTHGYCGLSPLHP